MNSQGSIKISKVSMDEEGLLSAQIEMSENLQGYFSRESLFFQYDPEALSSLPQSILVIPFLANLVTFSWAKGVDILLDEVDKEYVESLELIKQTFKKWYPQFSFQGKILATKVIENSSRGRQSAILFSSGLDSLSAYITNSDKDLTLFTVWGADISQLDNSFWELAYANISAFAQKEEIKNRYVRTNMRSYIKERLLTREFKLLTWWGQVSHGLVLTGAICPYIFPNFRELIVASTHNKNFNQPWGSSPLVDGRIRVAGMKVEHENYEFTRQEKIQQILTKRKDLGPFLRVCYKNHQELNCGLCEKCARTIIGLLIAGLDPRDYNFVFTERDLDKIKRRLERRIYTLGYDEIFMWEDLKKNLHNYSCSESSVDFRGLEDFWKWFRGYDIRNYKRNEIWYRIYKYLKLKT